MALGKNGLFRVRVLANKIVEGLAVAAIFSVGNIATKLSDGFQDNCEFFR